MNNKYLPVSYICQKTKNLVSKLKREIRLIKAKPKSISDGVNRVKRIKGRDICAWVGLAEIARQNNKFSKDVLQTLDNHDWLINDYATLHHSGEILKNYTEQLEQQAKALSDINYAEITEKVVLEIIKLKAIYQCRDAHTEGGYYSAAEEGMDWQWDNLIYPLIKDFDFSKVLELAPGHGRNSNKLRKFANEITLVDVNKTCIDACRARFGNELEGCKFYYAVNDGCQLNMVPDASITTIYSFDSMVHFDKTIVREYLREFRRILAPNCKGFLHHSNYGSIAPNSDWAKNPGNRSDVSAELFKTYAMEAGLLVLSQTLHGVAEGRSIEGLDCVSIIQRKD